MSKSKTAGLVFVIILILAWASGSVFDHGDGEGSAFYAARDAAKSYLPDAQFDSPFQARIFHREDGAYNVHGWTVTPRIEWGATVRYEGNRQWRTERLNIDGEQVIGD